MIYSRLLLIIFIAGQVIVYGHQHHSDGISTKAHNSSQQTVTERCQLCDAMHFNPSVLHQQVHVAPALKSILVYTDRDYNFISLALVRSAGRSPPIS